MVYEIELKVFFSSIIMVYSIERKTEEAYKENWFYYKLRYSPIEGLCFERKRKFSFYSFDVFFVKPLMFCPRRNSKHFI